MAYQGTATGAQIDSVVADHIAGQLGESLIQTLTAADLKLKPGDNDGFNTWAFDLTGVPAPQTGYRLRADFFHTSDITVETTIYHDVNQDLEAVDPDVSWEWNNYGQTTTNNGATEVNVNNLGWGGAQPTNIRGLRIVQEYIPIQMGGVDVVVGKGFHTLFDAAQGSLSVANLDTYNQRTDTELNGTFLNVVQYNLVSIGGSFNLIANPLEVCTLSLYAF